MNMRMRSILVSGFALLLAIAGASTATYSQAKKRSASAPRIEVQNYKIEASLVPDAHELKAVAIIVFKALEATNFVVFELSENLSVQKVLNSEGVELEFGQDEIGPGYLSVRFAKPLASGSNVTITVQYQGGFDRDRFSRIYSRDENSAYIGMEGTYLMYSAKWFPINRFLANRATATVQITVPLGMTAIGPGTQLPVVTRGINEVFGWTAKKPILPGSIVAGQYSQKKLQFGDWNLECFTKENKPDASQLIAETAAKILDFYQSAYGPSASGNSFRLVEVDEPLAKQPGMLGTIFVTRRELAQSAVPVRDLARRIAYQWWQETVGTQSSEDLWLVDGMAYFSAAQYMGKAEGPSAYKDEINGLAVLALKFEGKSAVRVGLDLGYRTDKYESVVAGKGAWIVNMLRGIMGDIKFSQLQQQYAHDYAGNGASTAAFTKLAEKIHGKELGWFFREWVDTIGVPNFQSDYVVFKTNTGFRVSGTLKQDRDLFRMPMEISVVGGTKEETKVVELNGKSASFDISTLAMPTKVILDPNNKLLRDSKELQTSVQLSLGNDLKQNGDFVEAIRAYEGALKLNSHRSLAHFRLAEVFYEQFNLQSAANSFRDALNGDKEPKWIEVWCYIYLGKIYDILSQRQRAMAEYTKALNTKDDTNGAQAEAGKWLASPFTRERTTMEPEKDKS
jgi:tetratricopeptide (TPR) repeat protein